MISQAQWREESVPGSPWHNMDADAALLADVRDGRLDCPVIRIYRWDRRSVSIGRLQQEEPVRRLYPDLPCVRRPTGGRAVLHGGDLTISVVAQTAWLPGDSGRTILSSYHLLMASLVSSLAASGHETSFGVEACGVGDNVHCFDSIAACDLVDSRSGRKLVGSAQRREGTAFLQQMSLPLALLPEKDEFVRALRRDLGNALCVEEWRFIDTICAV